MFYYSNVHSILQINKEIERKLNKGIKMSLIRCAILTVSDTCASGEKTDKCGPELRRFINKNYAKRNTRIGEISCTAIVRDDKTSIKNYLISWCDNNKADVIFTTGGTGISKRDVTPEATKEVIEKEVSGISTAMLIESLQITEMAMLSRAVCGIRKNTLIINLPGSIKAVQECLPVVLNIIPHALHLILDKKDKIKETHDKMQQPLDSSDKSCVEMKCKSNREKGTHENKFLQPILPSVVQRNRESPFPMISVKEALEMIYKNISIEDTEVVSTKNAHGRILFQIVYSACNLPPFRASIKDGYAVLASDGKGIRRVLCGVKAGHKSALAQLKPGTCMRVNTGAPVPDEATAVVQVEDTKLVSETTDKIEEKEIEIMTKPIEGQDIRPIGSDIKKGNVILNAFTRIGPVELGLLAACGCKDVRVMKHPSVGIMSTGDEIQEAEEPLQPGCVYDSNRITLIALLQENGFNSLDLGIVADDEITLIAKIKGAMKKVDVLVTTGSVSMGDRDILKPILQNYFGADIHFGRVNMKPGKPTTFASATINDKKKYFLCLPGNPVSATVTAHLFLLPLLRKMSGDISENVVVKAKLTSTYNLDPRPEYARAILKLNDEDTLPEAHSTGNQISSKLLNCTGANALLMLPGRTPEKQVLEAGDVVKAMLIGLK